MQPCNTWRRGAWNIVKERNIDELREYYLKKAPYPLGASIRRSAFTSDEIATIQKYGWWFDAICTNKVPLTTEKIKRFHGAKNKKSSDRSALEDLWVRYDQERHKAKIDHESRIQAEVITHIESYLDAEKNGERISDWEPCFTRLFREPHFCAATKLEYEGYMNNFLLSLMAGAAGFTSNAWGTRKQWEGMSSNEVQIKIKPDCKPLAWIAVPKFDEKKYRLNGFF